ncbi:MAG: 4Fe-4S binding protein [Pseudomonadota bacterium]
MAELIARFKLEPGPPAAPPRATWLARLGHALQRNRRPIQCVQWLFVLLYLLLLIVPAWLPLPPEQARLHDNLVRFAQFLFWGVWWPFVILSVLLFGRLWCGIFCPEGSLSEWVSHRSRNLKPIPNWFKWPGWPFVAFLLTTIYGQLVSVYDYARPALLILGGSTGAAMLVAFFWGKDRRIWCRYLCPVTGVFAVLSRLSPLVLRVDTARWDANKSLQQAPVLCPPLLNVRQLDSMAECHQCMRCSGHRDAVELAWRSPHEEILRGNRALTPWHHRLLLYGMLGLASGAFQWSVSPWLVQLKQFLAGIAVKQEWWWLLQDSPAWWLLTRYPSANDVFNWLDGLCLLIYLTVAALVIGGSVDLATRIAARLAVGRSHREVACRLLETLTPMAGLSLFLGLSMMTVSQLAASGIQVPYLTAMRSSLLLLAYFWPAYLLWHLLDELSVMRRGAVLLMLALGSLPWLSGWLHLFWLW